MRGLKPARRWGVVRWARRLADTWWLMRRLGYPLQQAWQRAGWWQ